MLENQKKIEGNHGVLNALHVDLENVSLDDNKISDVYVEESARNSNFLTVYLLLNTMIGSIFTLQFLYHIYCVFVVFIFN